MNTPAASLFDRRTLEQLDDALREGVVEAVRVRDAVRLVDAGETGRAGDELKASLEACVDIRLLFLGFQFFFRTGDFSKAERLTLRRLEVAEREGETVHVARACTNLGLIHLTTARRDSAKALMERAVRIDERLGNDEGLARDLGNLANAHEEAGDLDAAEALNRRSLEIATRIGAGEIAAGKLANLGDIALARGNAVAARSLWIEARDRFAALGIEKWRRACEAKLDGLANPGQ